MAGTTTNNGWTYPTSTDLVTNGATAIQTLATGIDTSIGTGLKTWQTWAPSMSGWTGSGTWGAGWSRTGNIVTIWGRFIPSSTTNIGTINVTLPVTARYGVGQSGSAFMLSGGSGFVGGCRLTSTTNVTVYCFGASGNYATNVATTNLIPNTWSAGGSDYFVFTMTYEAA